jgi:hypothetical protein
VTVMNAVSSYTVPVVPYHGVTSILTAAVVNSKFRTMLLSDPANALDSGYCGQRFYLKPEEKERILSIHASNLTDFALQLTSNAPHHE